MHDSDCDETCGDDHTAGQCPTPATSTGGVAVFLHQRFRGVRHLDVHRLSGFGRIQCCIASLRACQICPPQ